MRYLQNCSIKILFFLFLISFPIAGVTQEPKNLTTDSASTVISTDSLKAAKDALKKDEKPLVKLAKKKYNHREQVIFAVGMMAFIGIILGTAQAWNPD